MLVAVDRLAQIIQVAKTTDCLSGRKCNSVQYILLALFRFPPDVTLDQ